MPSTISFTPSWPPRLMICSSAGIVASPPSRPKRLVPRKRSAGEFLEAFRLDQLVEDRLLAFGREDDLLVRAFDAALQPVLLLGIVDVHELVADAAAIGALQDLRPSGAAWRVSRPSTPSMKIGRSRSSAWKP